MSAATTTSTATQPLLIADDIDTSTHNYAVATSDVFLGESAAAALDVSTGGVGRV